MASLHQHGHTYDLFVSYSSRDQEWVRPFVADLVKDVNRLADNDIFPFLDQTRLQPGYQWNETMIAAVRDSAILLPVLSHRFFQSEYCQKEVAAFIDAFGLSSAAPHRSRILPLNLLTTAPKDHPLAPIQATNFYAENESGIPLEHQPGSPPYIEALRKLAYAVAQILQIVPPKAQRRPAVYLASDFKPATEKLRASLDHNFAVLPESPQALFGLSVEELHASLAADFSRCFVSIHPFGDAPLTKALLDAQLAFARGQKKPRLLWAPAAPPAELTNDGFEWFTSQADIEDRIRRLWEKPAETKSGGLEPLIYFLCPDRANKLSAESLLKSMESGGVRIYPSPLDGLPDQALQTHVQALDELDGCLIYYGDVGREWFDSVFLRVRKKIRQRGLPSAIFLAPPSTDHKTQDLRNLGVPVVVEAQAALNAFLAAPPQTLRAGTA